MVKIYLGDIATIKEKERLLKLLPADRVRRTWRLRKEEDRLLSIGAGTLLRVSLSEYEKSGFTEGTVRVDFSRVPDSGPAAERMQTVEGPHGKPELPAYPGFFFNLSHSGTKVMLACSDAEIGCDVQKAGPCRERVLKRAFAPSEKAYVNGAEGEERDVRFTEVWALKESFLKAVGTGICTELDAFAVIDEAGQPGLRMRVTGDGGTLPEAEENAKNQAIDSDGADFEFQMWKEEGYVMAVCQRSVPKG